jgi:alkylation response protein AidB-like acyl-CoA dehydrogenase
LACQKINVTGENIVMDFSFSKSEKLLQKSARDFLTKECADTAREAEKTDESYLFNIWNKIVDLGWTGIGIPEEYGGMGGDVIETAILIEEMGRALLPAPLIPSVACSASALCEHGSDDQKKTFLPKIADGKAIIVPALIRNEPYAGVPSLQENISKKGDDLVFSGTRLFVPYAHMANWIITWADTEPGTTCFIIEKTAPGITCTPMDTTGSEKLFEVTFDHVHIQHTHIIGKTGHGGAVLKTLNELGALSHSAYLLGIIEKILDITAAYAKQRHQFGRPIGSFQAICHQLADMALQVEQVKYLTYLAYSKLSGQQACTNLISMAKARASDAARFISLFGVKIHGGIGIIDEYDMQLYFRNAKVHELAFGDADFHREVVAKNIGLQ